MQISQQWQAARDWAKMGFHVFPCLPGQKIPATPNGYKDATDDIWAIDKWWTENSEYNPACYPEASGHCVLDIDDKRGKDGSHELAMLEIEHGDLPETFTTHTPSGGRHLWFDGSIPSTVEKLGPGIDTRGQGGYVLLPGAVIGGVPYTCTEGRDTEPVAAWITSKLGEKREKKRSTTDIEDSDADIARVRAHLKNLVKRGDVSISGQGGNDRAYRLFTELRDLGVSEDTAVELVDKHWNPHGIPPRDFDELEAMAGHAWKYAQNEPGCEAIGDPAAAFVDLVRPKRSVKPETRSKFYVENIMEQNTTQEPEWIIPKRLPKRATIMIYGPPKSYKSFYVLDEMLALAVGRVGYDKERVGKPQRVVYVAGEGAAGVKTLRRPAWQQRNNISDEGLMSYFYVISTAPMIIDHSELEAFIKEIEKKVPNPDIIVMETMSRLLLGMNENDSKDAGQAVAAIEAIRAHFDCTIIVVHHSGKDTGRGARGSSTFFGNFDVVYSVTGNTDATSAKVVCEKMKDAEDAPDLYLKGYNVANSLVFEPITPKEFAEINRKEEDITRSDVGKSLTLLGAYAPRGTSNRVLSAQLIKQKEDETVEDYEYRVGCLVKRLNKRAKKDLSAYVVSEEGETVRWGMPVQEG